MKYQEGTKLKVLEYNRHSPPLRTMVGRIITIFHSKQWSDFYEIKELNSETEDGFIPEYIENKKHFSPDVFESWKKIIEG